MNTTKSELRRKLEGFASGKGIDDKFFDAGQCFGISRIINKAFPQLKVVDGYYRHKLDEPEILVYHSWNEPPDGMIIDASYGQFNSRIKIGIWAKGSSEYKKYISEKKYKEIRKLIIAKRKLGDFTKKDLNEYLKGIIINKRRIICE